MAYVTKGFGALMAFTLVAQATLVVQAATAQSPGVTADLAKKCRQLAVKAHPNAKPGSKPTGAEKSQRDYFSACVAKGGNMDN
jgi:hypothetical protein